MIDCNLPAQHVIYLITFCLFVPLLSPLSLSLPLFSPSHSSRLKFPSSRVLRARVNYLLHTPQSRKCQFLISVYTSSFLDGFSYIIESSRMGEKSKVEQCYKSHCSFFKGIGAVNIPRIIFLKIACFCTIKLFINA